MKNEYCGRALKVPTSNFIPKSISWDSSTFLIGLNRSDILLTEKFIQEKEEFFLHAAYTEFDAENLCRHLEKMNYDFSPEFLAFEKVWRRDEWNHYLGFRFLYSIMYNQTQEDIAEIIEKRPSDFTSLSAFFKDEFFICLLIAFDEILTTKSYTSEYGLYKSFGHPSFLKWIKAVTRDESYHFYNAMEVIRIRHRRRIHEIPTIIDSFVSYDLNRNGYQGTFVLDHDWYSKEFLEYGANKIKSYF